MSRLAERWQELVGSQDAAAVREAHSVRAWMGAGFGLTVILLGLAYVPGVSSVVGLATKPALAMWLGTVACQLASASLMRARTAFNGVVFGHSVLSSILAQIYTCALIDFVSPQAAPVASILFVFTAVYHAWFFRSGPRHPVLPLVTLFAAAIGTAIAPTLAHRTVFAVVGPVSVVAGLLAGAHAFRSQSFRREQDRLKEALRAQELLAAKGEIDRLGDGLKHLLGAVHDIANALGSIRAEADFLALSAQSGDLSPDELKETSAALIGSVETASRVAHEAKQVGRGELLSPVESVALGPVVEAALAAARFAHPAVTFVGARAHENVCVRIRGGGPTLRRMLENLLLNAVQGDGTKGAHRVELSLERDATGLMAALHVADDGPGFRVSLLQEPIRALDTTKKNGTGVGLFTAERFAIASGGRLERTNRAEGGARVSLVLRQEHA